MSDLESFELRKEHFLVMKEVLSKNDVTPDEFEDMQPLIDEQECDIEDDLLVEKTGKITTVLSDEMILLFKHNKRWH